MKQLTGMDCPGCGMQRAVVALLRGDLGESLMLHPAAIPTLFIFIYLALHLRFKFAHGAAVLKWTFILIATITTLNYIFKIIHYGKS